jgi:ATP-binding cassette subfamily F protein uup
MSILVSVQGLTKSYGLLPLFQGLSLGFNNNQKVGLIGPNGSGKSTFLKILVGYEEPDDGVLSKNRQCEIVYLTQTESFAASATVQECLEEKIPQHVSASERPLRVQEILRELSIDNPHLPISELSGGWRKRVALGQALIQQPDLLLLDEPTNHLDLEGVLWLEDLLKQATFSFVLVSHDREFLQQTTNQTIELNKSYPTGFLRIDGPYKIFQERKEEFIRNQQAQQETLANKMRREDEWLKRGPKARTTKAHFRVQNAELMRKELQQLTMLNSQNRQAGVDFEASNRKTKKLIELVNVSFGYPSKVLFFKLSLALRSGACLGVLGQNGSGKSSLLKLLKKELRPDQGEIRWAESLKVVHFDQHRDQLSLNQTLKQALSPGGDTLIYQERPIHVAAWASRFLFPKEKLTLPLSQLSGGERARVLIANLMLEPADVLLLDEPTNDLDISTLEVLEESLMNFPGAILLITHDRYLMDRLSDYLICLQGDGGVGFFADYAQWQQHQKSYGGINTKHEISKKEQQVEKRISYEDRKEWQRIEGKIQKAESEVLRIQALMDSSGNVQDLEKLKNLSDQLMVVESKVQQLYDRWAELEELFA